jgi:hypothetical protein
LPPLNPTSTSGGVGLRTSAASVIKSPAARTKSPAEPTSSPAGLARGGTSHAIVSGSVVEPLAATTSQLRPHSHTRRIRTETPISGTQLGGWPGGLPQAPRDDPPIVLLGILGLIALALAGGAAYRRRHL